MLEADGALRTWRLLQSPNATEAVTAEPLPNHRLEYLDYEGPVSNNRGHVKQLDHGEFTLIRDTDAELAIQLLGKVLSGRATITFDAATQESTFRFEPDSET